uniref:Uncharacterized protein n=1 Tax=Romanomermis culicivorax TaxID=13658 RepID=A0A915J3Y7_ROMCU
KIGGPDWPIYYLFILILLYFSILCPNTTLDAWTLVFDLAAEGTQFGSSDFASFPEGQASFTYSSLDWRLHCKAFLPSHTVAR